MRKKSAELLQRRYAKTPLTGLLTDLLATVVDTADRRTLVLLPPDWRRWTMSAESTLCQTGARVRRELKATSLRIFLTGKASAMAANELAVLGLAVERLT